MEANPPFGNVYVPLVAPGFLLAYPYLCHIVVVLVSLMLVIRYVLVQVLFLHEVSYALNAAANSTLYIYGTLHPESSKLKHIYFYPFTHARMFYRQSHLGYSNTIVLIASIMLVHVSEETALSSDVPILSGFVGTSCILPPPMVRLQEEQTNSLEICTCLSIGRAKPRLIFPLKSLLCFLQKQAYK